MRAHRRVLTSIGLATVLSACGSSPPPPPPPPKSTAAPAQAPAPAAQPPAPAQAPAPAAQPPATPAQPPAPTTQPPDAPAQAPPLAARPPAAPTQAPEAAAQGAAAVPTVPPEPSVAIPKYDPKGRRDPFEHLVAAEGAGGLTVASTRLTGIVRSTRAALALIEAPDGIGYILKPGDTLGDGRLLEIGSDSVVFMVTSKPGAPANRVVLRLATN